jgi:hypothetical protein
MTNEDIIRMAQEAGFSPLWLTSGGNPPHFEAPAVIVARFAALVAAAEREALESLIEHIKNDWVMDSQMKVYAAEYLLSAIRVRGQE